MKFYNAGKITERNNRVEVESSVRLLINHILEMHENATSHFSPTNRFLEHARCEISVRLTPWIFRLCPMNVQNYRLFTHIFLHTRSPTDLPFGLFKTIVCRGNMIQRKLLELGGGKFPIKIIRLSLEMKKFFWVRPAYYLSPSPTNILDTCMCVCMYVCTYVRA